MIVREASKVSVDKTWLERITISFYDVKLKISKNTTTKFNKLIANSIILCKLKLTKTCSLDGKSKLVESGHNNGFSVDFVEKHVIFSSCSS